LGEFIKEHMELLHDVTERRKLPVDAGKWVGISSRQDSTTGELSKQARERVRESVPMRLIGT
jgi:hypothetical protein